MAQLLRRNSNRMGCPNATACWMHRFYRRRIGINSQKISDTTKPKDNDTRPNGTNAR